MDEKVLISGVRLVCLIGVLYTTITLSWMALVWITALCVSVFLIHPSGKSFKFSLSEEDPFARNPLKNKPRTSAIDLSESVKYNIYRDIENFVLYDAENVKCLHNFSLVKNQTECLFAKKANIWGSPDWSGKLSLEEHSYRTIPMFMKFSHVCTELGLDGFLYEVPGAKYAKNVQEFGHAVRCVLKMFSDHDPTNFHCMDKLYIDKKGWVFEFNRITFFITTFAPFYSKYHSRHSFSTENAFILFQPEISFARHDIPRDTPNTEWENPRTIRDKIRVAFKEAGRPYKIRETISYPMVYDIVKPMDEHSDNVMTWWKDEKKDA